MKKEDTVYLKHILDAITRIEEYTDGITFVSELFPESELFISCRDIECNILHTNRAHLPFYLLSLKIYNPHHQQYQF
jgi:uncharacterized protein with HEPN domain